MFLLQQSLNQVVAIPFLLLAQHKNHSFLCASQNYEGNSNSHGQTNHILTSPLTRSLWVFFNVQSRLRHICIFKAITVPVTWETLIICSLNRKLSLLCNTHVVDSDGSVFMDSLDVAWGQPQQTHSSHYFQNSLQYPKHKIDRKQSFIELKKNYSVDDVLGQGHYEETKLLLSNNP